MKLKTVAEGVMGIGSAERRAGRSLRGEIRLLTRSPIATRVVCPR